MLETLRTTYRYIHFSFDDSLSDEDYEDTHRMAWQAYSWWGKIVGSIYAQQL